MKDEADIREQLIEEQRKKNREEMPEVAKIMDEINPNIVYRIEHDSKMLYDRLVESGLQLTDYVELNEKVNSRNHDEEICSSLQFKTMQKHNTSSRDFISFQNIALHFVRKLS